MTNESNNVFYVGETSNLIKRVYLHKEKKIKGFTEKYNLTKLVYYELLPDKRSAIIREKYIKGKSRQYKLDLIRKNNVHFTDLYSRLVDNDK